MILMNITAVVVTYNRVELLRECLESLMSQKELNGIIVVNNASTDETKSYLDNLLDNTDMNIHLIHSNTNYGGAGGFHLGLESAVKFGYDYVWIMDDDAIPTNSSLLPLIQAAGDLSNDFGFLASNILDETGCCMNTPKIDLSANATGYPDWASKLDLGYLKISMATFVSIFIKVSVIKDIGLPIREMFIWGDDSEYTQRISKIYPSYFVPKSKTIHKRQLKSSLSIVNETSSFRLNWYKLMYRNNGYRVRKHEGIKEYIKFILSSLISLMHIILKSEDKKIIKIKILLSGLILSFFFNPKIKFPK